MRIDVHPDDLFDKETRGALTDEERRHLDTHLESCDACRFERKVRADFQRRLSQGGAIAVGETASLRVLVSGVIASQAKRQVPERGGARRLSRISIARSRHWALLLAAALVFACGLAAAQTGIGRRAVAFVERAESLLFGIPAPATRPALHGSDKPARRPPASPPAPVAAGQPALAPAPEDPVGEQAAETPLETPKAAGVSTQVPSATSSRAPTLTAAHEPDLGKAFPSPPRAGENSAGAALAQGASALFDRANEARRHGRGAEATSLYRELRARYPHSAEAKLSSVLVGRLLLDRGDPGGALSAFDSYLATPDTALREEALAGCALAMGRLGRTEDEKHAWSRLLSAYPHSSYLKLAAERLGQSTP